MDSLTYAYDWARSRNVQPIFLNRVHWVWWSVPLPDSVYMKVRKGMHDSEEKAYESLAKALEELKEDYSVLKIDS